MDDYLNPPPGWHYSVHPWFSMDDIDELPDLKQVGTVLLPEFFHLAVGTEGMWGEKWPSDDDFALFLHFQVFEGKLTLSEARSAGADLPTAYEKFRKVVPARQWKPLGAGLMTRYLTQFIEYGGRRPDEEMLPAHGPRAIASYEARPGAAMLWLEQLEAHASEAYATARDKTAPRRKRNRITDEFLREVAKVYGSADRIGKPPTREVANHFDAPHSTAAKWVAAARRKGFLPPPGEPVVDPDIAIKERILQIEKWIREVNFELSKKDEHGPRDRRALEHELKMYKEDLATLKEELSDA